MTTSIIYKNSAFYEASMVGLYGAGYNSRYRTVADLVPEGSSVLELCCGPGTLYRRYLKQKHVDYVGLDINAGFVRSLSRRGMDVRKLDVGADMPLPSAGTVIMQASLYHFLPDPRRVIDRMLAAATRQVIIAEPVRNISQSNHRLISWAARKLTNPGTGKHAGRFTEESLHDLLSVMEGAKAYIVSSPGKRKRFTFFTRITRVAAAQVAWRPSEKDRDSD